MPRLRRGPTKQPVIARDYSIKNNIDNPVAIFRCVFNVFGYR